jgi:hypothetical protein
MKLLDKESWVFKLNRMVNFKNTPSGKAIEQLELAGNGQQFPSAPYLN